MTSSIQGYLAYKKLPPPLGPYRRPMPRILGGFWVTVPRSAGASSPVNLGRLPTQLIRISFLSPPGFEVGVGFMWV